MKTLCLDIGNTSIKKTISLNNKIGKIKHLNYSKNYPDKVYNFLEKDLIALDLICICSVVPEINKFITKRFNKYANKIFFVQKSKLKKFIDSSVNINQLGTDRAINVLAVSKFYFI